jgi:maltose-6'-phosphate glucosidase
MIEIVRDARTYADDPWILNYTNPAAIVALALERVFPGDKKIINMCDQPVNLLQSFAKVLGIQRQDIVPEYVGLNHFGWFTKLKDRDGNDLLVPLRTKILDEGFLPADAAERDTSWLHTYAMVQTIMRDFPDYVPNTYLQYYLYPEQVVARLDTDHTRTEEVKNGRERRVITQCKQAALRGTTQGLTITKSEVHADMIVEVASSIAYDKGETFIMITKNNNTVTNFHENAMVETVAHVGKNGVTAVPFGQIDVFMKGLMEGQYAYESLTVDCYFEGSYKKALQALTLNRTLVDAKKARAVLDDLIDANQRYWPELV